MDKLTCECVPCGVEVLPKASEVEALEGALLRWSDAVRLRYGAHAAMATWRRACKVVANFERGE